MNWKTVIRFRKQVENMAREELALAEWEKSQVNAKREILRQDMRTLSSELEECLQRGVSQTFADQRFQWIEDTGQVLEQLGDREQGWNQKISGLRDKLREAHQSRRIIEIMAARKHGVLKKKMAHIEQMEQDEAAASQFVKALSGER